MLAAPTPSHAASSNEAYNVILLMTDEHTPRVLGCYGDPLVKTPTLDALAAKGVRFTSAYCQNPICVPSRVSLVILSCVQVETNNPRPSRQATQSAGIGRQPGQPGVELSEDTVH